MAFFEIKIKIKIKKQNHLSPHVKYFGKKWKFNFSIQQDVCNFN